jgi:UDP-hydrolysing UDP-N-acetyl-D-glucosamine 2-epimerase
MYAAALAALPFKIPMAHIHGGEVTRGAIDDALRHSITKLSHLHFVSTSEYGRRIVQLGEEPWRVAVTGAPGLDNLSAVKLLTINELEERYELSLKPAPLLVTFHPVTLEHEQVKWQMGQLLAALDNFEMPIIFTMPNADTGGRVIKHMIEEYVHTRSAAYVVDNLGTRGYFSMMAIASAMVGNSSSGIIEAPSFGLPVINIGSRQDGRVKSANVIDVGYEQHKILDGLNKALNPQYRLNLQEINNPYGSGEASEKIVEVLKRVELNDKLVIKYFNDAEG